MRTPNRFRSAAGRVILAWCVLAGSAAAEDAKPEPAKPPVAPRKSAAARTRATQKAITSGKINVDLRNVPFQEVLQMLTSQAGVALALDGRIDDETLKKPLSLRLRKGSVYAVLRWVFRKRDLAWVVDSGEILVAPLEFIDSKVIERQKRFIERTEKTWREKAEPKLVATKMSLNVLRVPLANVLDVTAERAGLNVVWMKDAEDQRPRRVTLKVSETTVREILDKLTAQAKLSWSLESEAIVISSEAP